MVSPLNLPPVVRRFLEDDAEGLPTPLLVADAAVLDRNLDLLANAAAEAAVRLRPHAKAHKCAEIARLQVGKGAIGICCQTVAEVEAFAAAGIADILLTNQIVDGGKARRLGAIDPAVGLGVCVDNIEQIVLLADTACRNLDIHVEVDVGGGRCGVRDPSSAIELARAALARGLRFAGLQAYNGKIQHVRNAAERRHQVRLSGKRAAEFARALIEAGFEPPIITGGGTGTAAFDLALGTHSELQCGTYALMDADYAAVERDAADRLAFSQALFVVTRVIGNRADEAILDAGLKALAFDSGPPSIAGLPKLFYTNPSDEHGILRARSGGRLPSPGALVALVPGHCDPTVAVHEHIVALDGTSAPECWPVLARGSW